MSKAGGYRISNRVKKKLVDIDEAALIAHDVALISEGLNERDKKALVSNCSKIREIVKEILQEW